MLPNSLKTGRNFNRLNIILRLEVALDLGQLSHMFSVFTPMYSLKTGRNFHKLNSIKVGSGIQFWSTFLHVLSIYTNFLLVLLECCLLNILRNPNTYYKCTMHRFTMLNLKGINGVDASW